MILNTLAAYLGCGPGITLPIYTYVLSGKPHLYIAGGYYRIALVFRGVGMVVVDHEPAFSIGNM